VPAPPKKYRHICTKMPTCSTGLGGAAIVVSCAMVGGGGTVGTVEVTTAGAAAAARSSRLAISSADGCGTTGMWWLIALFSGSPDSSSRTRRIS
jgi:hypothetical protein